MKETILFLDMFSQAMPTNSSFMIADILQRRHDTLSHSSGQKRDYPQSEEEITGQLFDLVQRVYNSSAMRVGIR